MNRSFILAAFVVAAACTPVWAQTAQDHLAHHSGPDGQAGAAMTPAEVRKVDKEAGKITLRHEAIVSLDMPAMTMVFRVSDPKFLDQVKSGDKIRVSIEKVGGQYTVTKIEQPAP